MRPKHGFLLICAAAAVVASLPARAAPIRCEELVAGLNGKGDLMTDYGAILLGVVQTAKPKMCIPNGTMLATLKAVFIHWTDEHPGEMQSEAWHCADKAFRESFPCTR